MLHFNCEDMDVKEIKSQESDKSNISNESSIDSNIEGKYFCCLFVSECTY